MNSHYRALRTISNIYKVIAILVFAGATLFAILIGVSVQLVPFSGVGSASLISGIVSASVVFIGGSISALGIYAVGELLQLLVELALNTRSTESSTRVIAEAAQQQLRLIDYQVRLARAAAIPEDKLKNI